MQASTKLEQTMWVRGFAVLFELRVRIVSSYLPIPTKKIGGSGKKCGHDIPSPIKSCESQDDLDESIEKEFESNPKKQAKLEKKKNETEKVDK